MTDQNECVKEQCETPFTSSKLMSSLIAHDLKSKESAEMRDILYELLGLARRAEKLFGCCGSYKTIPSEYNGSEEEDREMYEQPAPLAEWKALEPGRKVLNKFSKRVWSIVSFSERDNCYQLVDPENKEVGTSLGSSQEDFENNYQILHEGPFDAGKLQPGDWLWDEHYRQWVQFKEIASDGLIGIISHGINYYVNPYNPNLYFAPPSREERIEKALSNTTPYLSQDVIVPVEKLEAGRYRMMIPVEISTTGGLLLDRRDGLHGYSLEDYPNARFFKGW